MATTPRDNDGSSNEGYDGYDGLGGYDGLDGYDGDDENYFCLSLSHSVRPTSTVLASVAVLLDQASLDFTLCSGTRPQSVNPWNLSSWPC